VEEELPAEDAAALEALHVAVERELARVAVDFEAAASAILGDKLGADAAPDEDGWQTVIGFGFDADGLLAVLEPLPDHAGTAAVVAAFRRRIRLPTR
jgi:hypothetical protein